MKTIHYLFLTAAFFASIIACEKATESIQQEVISSNQTHQKHAEELQQAYPDLYASLQLDQTEEEDKLLMIPIQDASQGLQATFISSDKYAIVVRWEGSTKNPTMVDLIDVHQEKVVSSYNMEVGKQREAQKSISNPNDCEFFCYLYYFPPTNISKARALLNCLTTCDLLFP